MLFTPEMCGLIDRDRTRARGNIRDEAQDVVLAAARAAAAEHGIWVALGSLAIDRAGEEGADERYANRTFIIDDKGGIAARYDKMHMFDVDLATGERWRDPPPMRRAGRGGGRDAAGPSGAGDLL
jgi:predicted amidohydrolase